jgi:hypothetical protein
MKFEVPLMMPGDPLDAVGREALAQRLDDRDAAARTDASKATITPFFCAALKISLPCVASSALFAVQRHACRAECFEYQVLGAVVRRSARREVDVLVFYQTQGIGRLRLALLFAVEGRPCRRLVMDAPAPRRWISSALRLRTSQVPPPTVPMPRSPTRMGFTLPLGEARPF